MKKPANYGWIVVLGAFLALLIASLRSYSFGIFIDPLTADFGWPRAPLTLVLSISFLVTSFLGIVSGTLSDRYGVRKVMTVGSVLVITGFALSSQITSLVQLYLTFILIGIGASAFYIPVTTTVTRWFSEKRGLAVGITVSALGIGMAFFPPILERSISRFGWRNTFLIAGLISMILLSISILLMKRPPEDETDDVGGISSDSEDDSSSDFTLKQALKTKYFWLIYFMFMMAQFSAMTITVHIVPYSTEIGVSSFYAATLLTVIGISNICGRLLGGVTADRIGVIKGTSIFFAFQGMMILFLPFSEGLWMMYSISILFGLSYGGWVMIYPVIVSYLYGDKNSGAILGALGTVAGIGGALGPYIAGYIFDVTGAYDSAFLLSGAMMFLSLFLSLLFIKFYSDKGVGI
ncbi:MAG: MFS transporter [Candidatus Saliniplasma sp.]